jgi:hypothetical protein
MKISKQRLVFGIALITLCMAPATFAGKVYKWIDKDGNVQYSAQKPADNAQEMNIKTKPTEEAAEDSETSAESETDEKKQDAKDDTVKVSNEKEAAEIEKKNEEARKKNCSTAKKRLATINVGGRLYEVNEQGERSYWDDATRAAKLAEAQSQVDEWCKE